MCHICKREKRKKKSIFRNKHLYVYVVTHNDLEMKNRIKYAQFSFCYFERKSIVIRSAYSKMKKSW